MSKKIILALIGRGHWGQTYKKTIDGMPGILLPSKYIYGKDYRAGLKKNKVPNIDGVIVAATTSAHFAVATNLLKLGFSWLLIEKPLTQTFAQAQKLQKLLQTFPNSSVMVGHIMLYDPAYKIMKEAALKKLGKILQINYTALKGPPIKEGTVLQDAGPHPIYLFMDIAGKKPTKVSARSTKFDNIKLTLEFDNGLLGVAEIGTIYPERKRELVITGTKGKLVLNEFVNPRELIFFDNNGQKKNLSFPTNQTPLEREILEFVNLITTGAKPKTYFSSGVDVVKIIDLAEKSLRKKGESVSYN